MFIARLCFWSMNVDWKVYSGKTDKRKIRRKKKE